MVELGGFVIGSIVGLGFVWLINRCLERPVQVASDVVADQTLDDWASQRSCENQKTPPADGCQKLLDNKWGIVMFKNDLGSYTAVAYRDGQSIEDAMEYPHQITDDFTPSKAMHRLSEKCTLGRIVGVD